MGSDGLDRSKHDKLTLREPLGMLHCVIMIIAVRVNLDRSKRKDQA